MAGGGGQTQDPFAQLTAVQTPEEQALAAMSPTEALKFSKQLQNARVYSPEEAKANLKQTGYDIASVTPVLGNLIAAKDAYDYGGQTLDAAKTGDIREQRKAALMTELSALGAVTGLPFGKIAQQTAQEARSTANIFAGPLARTADKAALEQAQRLEAHGASPDDIWRDTGWGRIDGNWKFEIPDTNAKLTGLKTPADRGVADIRDASTTIGGLEHPEYSAAYGDTPRVLGGFGPKIGYGGEYSKGVAMSTIPDRALSRLYAAAPDEATAHSVTLHELQHHVQNIEGWQGGGNPQSAYDYRPVAQLDAMRQDYANKSEALYMAADRALAAGDHATAKQLEAKATELNKIFSQISKRGYGPYWRTAGEVEARNVQARRDFTPEQSRATPPWQTQDVPPELYTQLKKGEPQGPSAMAIDAYHGSPHEFDQFDLSKVGTGEGAQTYGHGLYFAENPAVGQTYLQKLSSVSANDRIPSVQYTAKDLLNMASKERSKDRADYMLYIAYRMMNGRNFTQAIRGIPEQELLDTFGRNIIKRPGGLYKVELDVEPHQLLDWDKPLSEQRVLHDRLEPIAKELLGGEDNPQIMKGLLSTEPGKFYSEMINHYGSKDAASARLHEAGIPGIRYLDQGSRGKRGGTSNYVIFDDKLVKIKHRE